PGGIRRVWLLAQGTRQQIGGRRFAVAPALDRGECHSSWKALPGGQCDCRTPSGAAAETTDLVWRLGRASDSPSRALGRRLVRWTVGQSRRNCALRAPVSRRVQGDEKRRRRGGLVSLCFSSGQYERGDQLGGSPVYPSVRKNVLSMAPPGGQASSGATHHRATSRRSNYFW